MKCIYCSKAMTEVRDSRQHRLGVRRRRKCLSCGKMFTTTESALAENLFVEKSSGKRQRFRRDKLFIAIFRALYEGKNPDNGDIAMAASRLTDDVCTLIVQRGQRIITSASIARMTYEALSGVSAFHAEKYRLYSHHRRESIEL